MKRIREKARATFYSITDFFQQKFARRKISYKKLIKILSLEHQEYYLKPCSVEKIIDLLNKYVIINGAIKQYCCYGIYNNCWIELESDEEGWWHVSGGDKPKLEKRKKLVSFYATDLLKYQDILNKREIFIRENDYDNTLNIIIPMRDLTKQDIYLHFDFSQNVEDFYQSLDKIVYF